MDAAVAKIRSLGAKVVEDVPMISLADVTKDPRGIKEIEQLFKYEFRPSFEHFLSLFENPNKSNGIKTVGDLRDFNIQNAHLELPPEPPNQEVLDNIGKMNMTKEEFDIGLGLLRGTARLGIDGPWQECGVDLILRPTDARMATVASAAGYPVGTVPLGFANFNDRAFRMNVVVSANQEAKMIQLMSAWEKTFPEARAPPP